jgi:uncharacterized membrane protein
VVSREQEAVMPSREETRESGRAFVVMGWILVLFALLLMFLEPAAATPLERRSEVVAGVVVVVGLLLNIYGFRLRRRSY